MGNKAFEGNPKTVLEYIVAQDLSEIYVVSSSPLLVGYCNNVVPEITFRSLSLDHKDLEKIGDDPAEILSDKARLGYNRSGRPTLAGEYSISIQRLGNSRTGDDHFLLDGSNSSQQTKDLTKDFLKFMGACDKDPLVRFSYNFVYCRNGEDPKMTGNVISGIIRKDILNKIFDGVETPYHKDFRRKLLSFLDIPDKF